MMVSLSIGHCSRVAFFFTIYTMTSLNITSK